MRLIIKGAMYYDNDSDTILIPHYTGEFFMVDCSSYEKIEELQSRYDENYIKEVVGNEDYIEHEGEKYYSTEYSPYTVDDSWDLLSDLSDLYYQ